MEETESLALFLDITKTCRRMSEGSELQAAERILWAYIPRVEAITKRSFTQQQEAAHITAQGYLLAASLAGHRNDLQARKYYSEEALLYGKLAGDRNLQITSSRQLAITFDYLGHLDEALHIYQQTFPYLNETSPILQACIYADVSGTYAQLHREKEAFHFLEMAYERFPEKQENEPDFLSTICRYATLILCDGLHRLSFGRPHEAESVFAQIDGMHPKVQLPERIRIDVLNCQAETFFALEDLAQACAYLETAVSASIALGSERRLKESYDLFQQIQQAWAGESRIKQLHDLFLQHSVKHTK